MGFCPGNSCIYQLLAITYYKFPSFDSNLFLEIRSVFFDIFKAFNRILYDVLLFRLKQNGVSGNLSQLITSFLSGRSQKVKLSHQTSDWETIRAGVPGILGALFSLYKLITLQTI